VRVYVRENREGGTTVGREALRERERSKERVHTYRLQRIKERANGAKLYGHRNEREDQENSR